jgi:hypothetical protein
VGDNFTIIVMAGRVLRLSGPISAAGASRSLVMIRSTLPVSVITRTSRTAVWIGLHRLLASRAGVKPKYRAGNRTRDRTPHAPWRRGRRRKTATSRRSACSAGCWCCRSAGRLVRPWRPLRDAACGWHGRSSALPRSAPALVLRSRFTRPSDPPLLAKLDRRTKSRSAWHDDAAAGTPRAGDIA